MKPSKTLLATVALACLGPWGCDDSTSPSQPSTCDDSTSPSQPSTSIRSGDVALVGTAYSEAGGTAVLEAVRGTTLVAGLQSFGTSDVVLSASGGYVFALDRSAGVVTAWRLGGSAPAWQRNVGSTTNPYAVAVAGSKAFVARYNSSSILVLATSTGDSTGRIDLSAWANDSSPNPARPSYPDMCAIVEYGGDVYVVLQRLGLEGGAGYKPTDTSLVLAIDPSALSVERALPLKLRNPQAAHLDGNRLVLASVGLWTDASYASVLDGGIEALDLSTGTSTVLATEASLGGNVSDAVAYSANGLYAVAYTPGWSQVLLRVAGGAVVDTVAGPGTVGALAADGSKVWAGLSTGANRLFAFDPAGNATDSVETTLLPTSMAVVP